MTYSDVITLLMTFFILLLTFASDEPESFERMKMSMFGGKGSVGLAGDNLEAMDQESLVVRMRPKVSRLTMRGTETPPTYTDASFESLDMGLKELEESSDLAQLQRFVLEPPLSAFVTESGQLTNIGDQHLRLFATQMRRLPLEMRLEVAEESDLSGVIRICESLTHQFQVPPGSVSAGIANPGSKPPRGLRITITRVL